MTIVDTIVSKAKGAMKSYQKAYKDADKAYFKTPAGKKAKAVLKAGGGM